MRNLSYGVVALLVALPTLSISANNPASAPASPAPAATTAAPVPVVSDVPASLSAAPSVTPASGSSAGEYQSVNCNSNSTFSTNSCNQCFDGGNVKVGQRLTGLFDTWTNNTTSPLIAYRDEQKTPNMVRFGQTTWTSTPASEASIWKKDLPDIVWSTSGSGGRSSYILSPSQKVRFFEADLNAGYTLEKTDKKNGEIVGMLRYPVVSRVSNIQNASEGAPDTHYECVIYKLDAPVATPAATTTATPAPTPSTPKVVIPPAKSSTPATPNPKNMTQTETGPETLILIAAAFFIAFGLMMTLRKRS